MIKRLTLVLAIIVATLAVGLAERPVLGKGPAVSIPGVNAVVALKDYDFFATGHNLLGGTVSVIAIKTNTGVDTVVGIGNNPEVVAIIPNGNQACYDEFWQPAFSSHY